MKKAVVVGGGVIGVCCALFLQRDNYDVTLVERDTIGEGATWASCGSIAVSEVIPLSKPELIFKSPGWLLDPEGPLAIRPASALRILPWFMRFAGNSSRKRLAEIGNHLSQLTSRALTDYDELLGPLGLRDLIRGKPVIELYETAAELEAERYYHDTRRDMGHALEEISGREAAEIEPAIAKDFEKALVFKDWRSIVDGKRFVTALVDAFAANGGTVLSGCVSGLQPCERRVERVVLSDGRTLEADLVILSAGAWTRKLARPLGAKISMEGVGGYQTLVHDPAFSMQHAIVYAKGGFGITPYESGLAIGGSIEFASMDAQPNWNRADVLVRKSRRVIPSLNTSHSERRFARRPLTPDTLPVIDRTPAASNVFIATGHGQLGVTLGAMTGKVIADLACGRPSDIDLSPYSLSRF